MPDNVWPADDPAFKRVALDLRESFDVMRRKPLKEGATGTRVNRPRHSMTYFLHFNSDFPIATLPGRITLDRPNRYPEPILADDHLRERLREIKLLY